MPIVNSAATDPTIPETIIPWYLTTIQDDRVQGYTLARRIYTDLGLKKIALLRVNDRYGRFGVIKFKDASRRLGHPVLIEQKYLPGDTDFPRALRIIEESGADAIVHLGRRRASGNDPQADARNRDEAARLRQFPRARATSCCENGGDAAEGLEACIHSIRRATIPVWIAFDAALREALSARGPRRSPPWPTTP